MYVRCAPSELGRPVIGLRDQEVWPTESRQANRLRVLALPGAEALDRVELVLARRRFDLVSRRTAGEQLDQVAVLADGLGAAVRDLDEDGAADRVQAAGDVAQHRHQRGVRAALVDQR